jgi:hypothetical protein
VTDRDVYGPGYGWDDEHLYDPADKADTYAELTTAPMRAVDGPTLSRPVTGSRGAGPIMVNPDGWRYVLPEFWDALMPWWPTQVGRTLPRLIKRLVEDLEEALAHVR